jgi:hypothetical protein
MFSLNGCTVKLPNGQKLLRQRVSLDENLVFVSVDRRTSAERYRVVAEDWVQKSKKLFEILTADGVILVSKSGCGCGR